MSRAIDAEALEKDGWMMHRTVQVDKNIMSYETKKPTDFPTIEPERRTGQWKWSGSPTAECDQCGHLYPGFLRFANYCPNCGSKNLPEGAEQEWI